MIPFKDDNPTRLVPFVTIALLLLNVAVFVRLLLLPPEGQQAWVLRLAIVPYDLTHLPLGRPDRWPLHLVPLLTAMFVHAGWLHLLGNMLYLWIFGNNVEDVMGHGRFVVFYFLCGLLAAGLQVLMRPESRVPMIGASGAIAGVLGAYLISYPGARIASLVPILFIFTIVDVPAVIFLIFWFVSQLYSGLFAIQGGSASGIAWWAHIGGFIFGLIMVSFFGRRTVYQRY